ncbi:hypothetical protein H6P81_019412 [Aristolochia fimbriata]|uniref:Uncharacterized protein n=1 Tax=Aristolochia fimbriata TaxID=158543 RepID=A0AAV7DUT0_ARIFI|nr:hypothetical protein H6P81_019412 [Aristolochia fimbriata]
MAASRQRARAGWGPSRALFYSPPSHGSHQSVTRAAATATESVTNAGGAGSPFPALPPLPPHSPSSRVYCTHRVIRTRVIRTRVIRTRSGSTARRDATGHSTEPRSRSGSTPTREREERRRQRARTIQLPRRNIVASRQVRGRKRRQSVSAPRSLAPSFRLPLPSRTTEARGGVHCRCARVRIEIARMRKSRRGTGKRVGGRQLERRRVLPRLSLDSPRAT